MNKSNVPQIILDGLEGRLVRTEEVEILHAAFLQIPYLYEFIDIISKWKLINTVFSLEKEVDLSGFGVEMKWLTPKEQIDEATNAYPGVAALREQYLPIGDCLEGSGDPYFIKLEDGQFNIFRIRHDSVMNNTISVDDVESVCSLDDLLINGKK